MKAGVPGQNREHRFQTTKLHNVKKRCDQTSYRQTETSFEEANDTVVVMKLGQNCPQLGTAT